MKNSIFPIFKLIFIFIFVSILKSLTNDNNILLFAENNTRYTVKLAPQDRRGGMHDANLVRTVFYNYGSIGRPNWEPSMEWPKYSGHGYTYEFGIMVGAEVVDVNGDTIHTISEALIDGGDVRGSKVLGWQPLAQYINPVSITPAMSNDPNSWPSSWSSWFGLLGNGIISADLESYYVMDDRDNDEFEYYPIPADSSIRGLGIEVSCRGYQWNNAAHEDFLIYHYTIKNVSNKALNKVVVGIFGDPHMGGPGDFSDDWVGYINADSIDSRDPFGPKLPISNFVYGYDDEGSGNDYGIPWNDLGWLGFKLLESPLDTSGNELGLTSVTAPLYVSSYRLPYEDEIMWNNIAPGNFSNIAQNQDNVIIFGSGYFSLNPGEEKVFSVAYILGKGFGDLIWNAINSQIAYSNLHSIAHHNVTFNAPSLNEEISGNYAIQWSATSSTGNPLTIDIYYNVNRGNFWIPLVQNLPNTGSYLWNTGLVPDGYNYQLDIIANDGQIFGNATSDYFIVNNPQNFVDPEIILLYPQDVPVLQGNLEILWRAGDVDGDSVTINLYYSNDRGNTWNDLSLNEQNDGNFLWETISFPNGTDYQIKLAVTNGTVEIESLPSSVFSIANDFPVISDSSMVHVQGEGDGSVVVTIVDPSATTGHNYQLTFDDTSDVNTTYDVFDLNASMYVVENAEQLSPNLAGPLFDGLRLEIDDIDEVTVDIDSSGWTSGNCNLELNITLFPTGGIRLPVDYNITFYNTFVDTSILINPKPIYFQIWNLTDSLQADVVFIDNNNNDIVEVGDLIIPIYYDNGMPKGTWQIEFLAPNIGNAILPTLGDELTIFTFKPFTFRDVFEFQSPLPVGLKDVHSPNLPGKFNLFQNYPNPFNNSTTIEYQIPKSSSVNLVIFDITGKKIVQLVDQKQNAGKYSIIWNGKNHNHDYVASGLYFYRIITGEFSKVKKCLIIK
jgi:hypothetical protein